MNLTVMVKYRAIGQQTPVSELFRLGTLPSIADELRLERPTTISRMH
jgi:hypothetical protein